MYSLIKNKDNANDFLKNGFCIVKNINESDLKKCETFLSEEFQDFPDNMFISHYENDLAKNLRVSQKLNEIFSPWLNDIFEDFKYVLGHFIVKSNVNSKTFNLHQDWSVVDEEIYPFIHIWIPLQDTSEQNGGLYVIPKSHKFFNNKRSGSLGIPFVDINLKLNEYIKNLSVLKTEALLYHPALFHGSLPNNTFDLRKTILLTITSKDANFKYFHIDNESQIFSYEIDEHDLLFDLPRLAKGDLTNRIANKPLKIQSNIKQKENSKISTEDLIEKLLQNEK